MNDDERIFPQEPAHPDELDAQPALPTEPLPSELAHIDTPELACALGLMGSPDDAAAALTKYLGVQVKRKGTATLIFPSYHLAVGSPTGRRFSALRLDDVQPVLAYCRLSPLRLARGEGWSVWITTRVIEQMPEIAPRGGAHREVGDAVVYEDTPKATRAHAIAAALLTVEQLLGDFESNRAHVHHMMD
jgi:hypothetical protein